MSVPDRVRRDLDRRRSGAGGFHQHIIPDFDWMAEWEQERDEPGEAET